ncbi:ribonucleoprotein RB97D isoform X1 [Drosophila simulans]|uniref:ribonucleoprotein RB97D isoform X1 n=2 Tax=Drosophila simulans TaxID=7240 RepID=UPI00192CFD96|nr:ribonucleoprotein RB97D isoform X1 [Drosophila simulans]
MDSGNCASSVCLGDSEADRKTAIKDEGHEHLRKIFIGGLSTQTSVDKLREFFSQFGVVSDAVVMRDPMSNHSRGFGFVTFVDPKSVEIVQRARPHTIDNKIVETKHALPRQEFKRGSVVGGFRFETGFVNSKRIFLGGLKEYHDEKVVREYFSQFGPVASVKLLIDRETGRQRAFGFLEFVDPLSADKALAPRKHWILQTLVEVKRSTQKPDRRFRYPISSSVRAGYIPPQPATADSYNYNNPNYNPYLAQSVLPPSAFTNGWAHYVIPMASKPTPGQNTAPKHPFAGHGPEMWSTYPKPGTYPAQEWTPSKVGEWAPKPGHKHAQTSTNDRPKLNLNGLQAATSNDKLDLGAGGDGDRKSGIGLGLGSSGGADVGAGLELGLGLTAGAAVGVGAIKKWPNQDYKVFKPAKSPTNGVIPKIGKGATPPPYGI